MTLTLELPDDIAQALGAAGDLSRRALEALAVEAYWRETLSQLQVGKLLGLTRFETEDFLARHVDMYTYDLTELHREAATLEKYAERRLGSGCFKYVAVSYLSATFPRSRSMKGGRLFAATLAGPRFRRETLSLSVPGVVGWWERRWPATRIVWHHDLWGSRECIFHRRVGVRIIYQTTRNP